jgi:hypothetical protein
VCYADSSYAIHEDAKSHSGISISLTAGGAAILAMSKKQTIVAQSSTEAELVALHSATRICVWLQQLLISMGLNDLQCPLIYQDNNSTIILARGGKASATRTKHINVRYFSMKEYLDNGQIEIAHKGTDEMVADVLTKPLHGGKLDLFRSNLLNCN